MKASAACVAPLALLILCTMGARVLGDDLAGAAEKSGSCPLPPSYTNCREVNKTEKLCTTDQQCPGKEKCCNYGCSFRCKMPLQVKEGSCASFDRAICIYVKPSPDACQSDNQCPGTERCCCRNCRRVCTATVKSGTCPRAVARCKLPLPDPLCQSDADCPGPKKCCSLCGYKCMDPEKVAENPGLCPIDPEIEKQCGYLPPPKCNSDAECGADEKCCLFGCGVQCVKALPDTGHPGMCPNILAKCKLPLPAPMCQSDNGCPKSQKCCNLCGKKCLDAEQDHTGFCPAYKPMLCDGRNISDCNRDSSCKADEKCCNVGCRQTCVKSKKEKPGVCPFIPMDELSEDMCNKCNEDKDCPHNEKCCAGGKGRECRKPTQEIEVKSGDCPRRISWCDRPPPYNHNCSKDSDCPGEKKCCIEICNQECKNPVPEVKSGDCPRRISWCDRPPPYNHNCSKDSDCPGEKKCCIEICNQECKNPVPVKTGECPKDTVVCKRAEPDQCNIDSNCTGNQRCCYFQCGLKCKDPDTAEPKQGICPTDTIYCIQAEDDQCKNDGDCPGDQKCCYFRCGLKCKAPESEKPGQCPVPVTRCSFSPPSPKCNQDSDCPGAQKCCTPACTRECTNITTVPEKPGMCPLPPSYPTCATFPSRPMNACATDQQCPGEEKCCEYGCSLQCKKPLQDKLGSCPAFNHSICMFARPAPAECSSDSQCPGTQRCCFHGNCRMECAETEKPGECPVPITRCATPVPPPKCKQDSDCPGSQKCCTPVCTQQCTNITTAKPKQGMCPKDTIYCIQAEDDQCKNDGNCPGDQKCCYFQCGLKCKAPESEKPGQCPVPVTRCSFTPPPPKCNQDSDCPGAQKCCTPACTRECTNITTVPKKPGMCPLPPSYPTCATFSSRPMNACTTDQQCPGEEKCCEYGCRLQCKKPLQDKLGSCPAFNQSICMFARPAPAECSSDSQCPGTQRCCCHGACRMECAETVKLGACPPKPSSCKLPLPVQQCEDDSGCRGKKKCCSQCGIKCTDPIDNPGFCPVDPEKEKQCGYLSPLGCSSDAECRVGEKCCLFDCGVQCVKALPVKPGMCPAILAKCKFPLDKPECQDDRDCPLNRKCCELCGNKCLEPVPDHAGVCPSYIIPMPLICPAVLTLSCNHDWKCEADEKCCTVGCQRKCVKALPEKMGACPKVPLVINLKEICHKCNNDKDCPGNERCCAGPKGRECQRPSKFVGLRIPDDELGS